MGLYLRFCPVGFCHFSKCTSFVLGKPLHQFRAACKEYGENQQIFLFSTTNLKILLFSTTNLKSPELANLPLLPGLEVAEIRWHCCFQQDWTCARVQTLDRFTIKFTSFFYVSIMKLNNAALCFWWLMYTTDLMRLVITLAFWRAAWVCGFFQRKT